MPTAGPNFPSTATAFSGVALTNPNNGFADDGSFATATLTAANASSVTLYTGMGFSIPADATITDVLIEPKAKRDAGGTGTCRVGICLGGGGVGFTQQAMSLTTTSAYGTANLLDSGHFNYSPTPTEANGSDFGALVQGIRATGTIVFSLDAVRITITYVLPSGIHMTQVRQAVQRAAVR